MQPAFARSYKTIIAADVVTGIAAVVLYLTAVSSVRGFALTLGVATLLDLFVVYFFKRPTVFLFARNQRLVSLQGVRLAKPGSPARGRDAPPSGAQRMTTSHHVLETYRGHTIPHFRFVERRNTWFAFSGSSSCSRSSGLVASELNYSIDFDGGAKIAVPVRRPMPPSADVQRLLADAGRRAAPRCRS